MPQRNLPENLVFWTISLTWFFYAFGALYVVGPVISWSLAGLGFLSLYLGPGLRPDLRPTGSVPPIIWGWIGGMLVMLVALWVGHFDWGLGMGQTIKSSIGWAKGWAMVALVPFAGAILKIRRDVVIRSQCIVGACTVALLPILLVAPSIGLPEKIFVSPLKAVGGPGPEYFSVYFYTLDPSSWTPRWQFYAPWSPFAGLLGVVMVLFALEDRSRFWMAMGILAGLAMVFFSKSRMSLVALFVCAVGPRMMPLLAKSVAWQLAAGVAASMAALGTYLLQAMQDAVSAFKGARADSTRVRETLQRIAYERWQNEAVWFGHGTVQPGPHIVEYMPIGSHHTWYGLLFVKGLVGVWALLVPLVWQFWIVAVDSVKGRRGRLPLGIVLVFIILSFGENIEIEAYLLWPALLLLGIHARELERDRLETASRKA
ncbi:capsular biosynthesis protein [Afifella marina]|nr:capsular biosynthesis protein [Afifella marina]MBK1624155.1 capsular biosynthesis protein [Afifella marina DSM 2698]MBK1627712.1 capsular biosynthesis protein [Afifella marina]MBK5916436.1 capsular biosynthesis protein [Afifella marina]RAI21027.1 capsular biosynthesis protein [Afifella marina DSM 2698]